MTLPAEIYARRFAAAEAEMRAAGIWNSNAIPPILRLLRKLGVQVRPPHFLPFARAAIGSAAYFGTIWGVLMYLLVWRAQQMPLSVAVVSSLCAGGLFGIFMAIYYRHGRKKHGFSNWGEL